VDWIGLAKDRNRWRALVNSVLNLCVPWNAGKLSSGLTTRGLSSSAQLHRVSYELWLCLCTINKTLTFNTHPKMIDLYLKWTNLMFNVKRLIFNKSEEWYD
jgi:hypothetical protein